MIFPPTGYSIALGEKTLHAVPYSNTFVAPNTSDASWEIAIELTCVGTPHSLLTVIAEIFG